MVLIVVTSLTDSSGKVEVPVKLRHKYVRFKINFNMYVSKLTLNRRNYLRVTVR